MIVDVRELQKSFGDHTVLDSVSFSIPRGSVFGLLGPNGAGKTTVVNILSTLLRPDGGQALVAGHDVATDPRAVRSAISVTGQFAAVDELLTGRENLVMMARLNRLPRSSIPTVAGELLDRFDLVDAASRRAGTYSGGMRRRLDIAISLLARPQVLFLDEPTTGLDPRSRQEVWAAVKELAADGTTVLLTTQYLEEADQLADRIAVLDDGRVVADGTAAELKSRVGTEVVEVEFADGSVEQIPTDGSVAQMRAILDDLDAASGTARRIGVRTPTLDDVFLTLTEPKAGALV
ncbi:putative multidrug ABC transporter ATP-binding protein [Gordonia araii NBRC 100433]|uniref:Putative multidrug ABC transporter ATP-binding protein n=1 Tax=Gordonia araii NBRC 100433 TaxID=1073574 RepID=G7H1U9_9ACTN|nr:daunorubicin resistance protein DrrA family ABC transporter ATP-binding protein [Gordonia araii]NNG97158.1 daunorubicin resistance protein DrrA family ABC transporter ATP-binding protein [Gordonia araii NBRC 100433]GAB09824.1 putative multidrug ABC transporter ATP-binding protein [Gordonia araii NBRC 100433]